jgi:hypothetical protein
MQVILTNQTIYCGASWVGAKNLRSRGGAFVLFNCLHPNVIPSISLLGEMVHPLSTPLSLYDRSGIQAV